MNYLILLYALLFFFVSFFKPRWALFLILAFLPSYLIRFKIYFIPFTLLELMILLLFLNFLLKRGREFFSLEFLKKSLNSLLWPILFLLLASAFSLLSAPDLRAALGIFKAYFVEPAIFLIIFVSEIKRKKDFKIIIWAFGFLIIYLSLFAFYQKITGNFIPLSQWQNPETRRVTTFFSSPNALALLLGPLLILYLGWLLQDLKDFSLNFSKIFFFNLKAIILFTGILAIIFSVSKGGWLALILASSFLLFFYFLRKKTLFILLLLLVVPLFLKYSLPFLTFENPSVQARLILWEKTFQILKERPIWGTGLSGFSYYFEPLRPKTKIEPHIYPHNFFLNFWTEIGLLGVISIIWLLLKYFQENFSLFKSKDFFQKTWGLILISAMIEILIHGLVDVPYFKNDLSLLFWTILALTLSLKKLK